MEMGFRGGLGAILKNSLWLEQKWEWWGGDMLWLNFPQTV